MEFLFFICVYNDFFALKFLNIRVDNTHFFFQKRKIVTAMLVGSFNQIEFNPTFDDIKYESITGVIVHCRYIVDSNILVFLLQIFQHLKIINQCKRLNSNHYAYLLSSFLVPVSCPCLCIPCIDFWSFFEIPPVF